jgi:hypothetical protein
MKKMVMYFEINQVAQEISNYRLKKGFLRNDIVKEIKVSVTGR